MENSLERRARWVVWFLVVVAAAHFLGLLADVRLLMRGPEIRSVRAGWLPVFNAAAFPVTALLFLRWFSSAYRNLELLGTGNVEYSRIEALASWFIPFVNLIVPKQVTDDLCRASDPGASLWYVSTWWGTFIAGNVFSLLVRWDLHVGNSAQEMALDATRARLLADACFMVAAGLALFLITTVTRHQLDRIGHLRDRVPGGVPGGAAR